MASWQPIETAPDDGTTVIATGMNYGRGPGRHVALVYFDHRRGGFYDRGESDDNYCYLTHWAPVSIPSFDELAPDQS